MKRNLSPIKTLGTAIFILCSVMMSCTASAAQTLTDLRGRTVSVPDTITSIAIDDSRFLLALSLIDKDPIRHLAGWPKDINRLGPCWRRTLMWQWCH